MRQGMAWVGVTAQKVGIVGGTNPLVASQALKNADPVRYAPLEHPGDAFSYDIYSQVGRAVREDAATVLGGLKPRHVVAVGESQSAFYLTTYVNALAGSTKVYDAFLLHGRSGAPGPLDGSGIFTADRKPVRIRTDVDVPVLMFETESDLVNLWYASARQPDTRRIRTWEVAGTSHYDTYGLVMGPKDPGDGSFDTALLRLDDHHDHVAVPGHRRAATRRSTRGEPRTSSAPPSRRCSAGSPTGRRRHGRAASG